jgi:hypothetical protein
MNKQEFGRRLFKIYPFGTCLDCPPYASPSGYWNEHVQQKAIQMINRDRAELLALMKESNIDLHLINEAIRKSSRCWHGTKPTDFFVINGGKLFFGHCLASEQLLEVATPLLEYLEKA